jgi:hypothetical protein
VFLYQKFSWLCFVLVAIRKTVIDSTDRHRRPLALMRARRLRLQAVLLAVVFLYTGIVKIGNKSSVELICCVLVAWQSGCGRAAFTPHAPSLLLPSRHAAALLLLALLLAPLAAMARCLRRARPLQRGVAQHGGSRGTLANIPATRRLTVVCCPVIRRCDQKLLAPSQGCSKNSNVHIMNILRAPSESSFQTLTLGIGFGKHADETYTHAMTKRLYYC